MRSSPFTPIRHMLATACLSAVLVSGAHAVPDAQFVPLFDQFEIIQSGNNSQLGQVADGFAALLRAEPTNPVLMAYTGTTLAMKANTTWLPWKKLTYAEDGMAMLDKALLMLTPAHDATIQHGTPGSLEVKLLAAKTFLAVPGFMNKRARGVKLVGELVASPLLSQAPAGFQGMVWLTAGELAAKDQRTADAKTYLNKVLALNAPQTRAARTVLAGL